jgi:hypothetical protein
MVARHPPAMEAPVFESVPDALHAVAIGVAVWACLLALAASRRRRGLPDHGE